MSLITALHSENERVVDSVCASGANPNQRLDGFTPMHLAVGMQSSNDLSLTKLLLQYGGDPNVMSDDSLTPVHVAVIWGKYQVLRLLLDNGGDPMKKDEDGFDALELAVKYKKKRCQTILEEFINEGHSDGEDDHYTSHYNQHVSLLDPSSKRSSVASTCSSELDRGFVSSRLSMCSSVATDRSQSPSSVATSSSTDPSPETSPSGANQLTVITEESSINLTPRPHYYTETESHTPIGYPQTTDENSPDCMCSKKTPVNQVRPEETTPGKSFRDLCRGELGNSFRNWTPKNFPKTPTSHIDNEDLQQIARGEKFLDVTSPDHCVVRQTPLKADDVSQIAQGVKVFDVTSPDNCRVVEVRSVPNEQGSTPTKISPPRKVTFTTPVKIPPVESTEKPAAQPSQSLDSGIDINTNQKDSPADYSPDACLPMAIESLVNKVDRLNFTDSVMTEDEPPDYVMTADEPSGVTEQIAGRYVESYVTMRPSLSPSSETGDLCVAEYIYTDTESNISLAEHRIPATVDSPDESVKRKSVDWKTYRRLSTICGDVSVPWVINEEVRGLTDAELYNALIDLGDTPGPITISTRSVYQRRLVRLREHPELASQPSNTPGYSRELQSYLNGRFDCTEVQQWELSIISQFDKQDGRKWREGTSKMSFTYLLLDPRTTRNLPARQPVLDAEEEGSAFKIFLSGIFYIGKGKKTRPYQHFVDAIRGKKVPSPKIQQILDVWEENLGVVSLHMFHNIIPVEAYTREACMVDAIGLDNLTNKAKCNYYGVASTWPARKRRLVGSSMLEKAYKILLIEGERQIRPTDIRKDGQF